MLTRYFGPSSRSFFGHVTVSVYGSFVVFGVDSRLYAYNIFSQSVEHLSHWKAKDVEFALKSNVWHQFTVAELETLLPGHLEGRELKAVKSLFASLPNASSLIDQPTVDGMGVTKPQPKKKKMSVVGQQPNNVKPAEVRPSKAKLYYNVAAKQVQRIVEIQGSLYWASYHKQECKAYPRNAFRLATQAEVDYYLANA